MSSFISRRPLGIESLEARLALAGNVTAQLSGPNLLITGDNASNAVEIVGTGTFGQFVVSGFADSTTGQPTTINGQTFVVISGVTADVIAHLNDGNDELELADATIPDDLIITTAGGHDDVILGDFPGEGTVSRSVHVNDLIDINTGVGDDVVDQLSLSTGGSNLITTGSGFDDVFVGPNPAEPVPPAAIPYVGVSVGANLNINTGDHDDTITVNSVHAGADINVHDFAGFNNVLINSAVANDDFFAVLGSGADILTVNVVRANDLMHINTVGGNDDVTVTGSQARRLEVFLGAGNDRLRVGTTRVFDEAWFDGGPGFDQYFDLGGNSFNRQRRLNFEA
jgi:hypothetical protein